MTSQRRGIQQGWHPSPRRVLYCEGNIICGRYRLERLLGEGGMATVWRAQHVQLGHPVAIKLLHPSTRAVERTATRFLREARIAAAIRQRHVVDIVDFGTAENGHPFMVMEFLEGEALAARLARAPGLEEHEIELVFDQLLSGLAAVHAAGITHRDLKPENVFLVEDAEGVFVKLLDFGVSRAAAETGLESVYRTRESLVVGTPHYMAPEQARGMRDVDARADLYAVGAMLFEVLTGRTPFDADCAGDLIVQLTTQPAPPLSRYRPDLPRSLIDLVACALARRREDRFPDALAMRRALRVVLRHEPGAGAVREPPPAQAPTAVVSYRPIDVPVRPHRSNARRRWSLALGAVALAAVGAATGAVVGGQRGSSPGRGGVETAHGTAVRSPRGEPSVAASASPQALPIGKRIDGGALRARGGTTDGRGRPERSAPQGGRAPGRDGAAESDRPPDGGRDGGSSKIRAARSRRGASTEPSHPRWQQRSGGRSGHPPLVRDPGF